MPKSVLVVEDSPTQLEVFKTIVKDAGYEVDTAASGEEALKVVGAKSFDLIILDLLLPRVDGFEVCRRIKRNPDTKKAKIIAVTSFDVKDIEEKVTAAGMDDMIIKPFKPEDIVAKIKKLIG